MHIKHFLVLLIIFYGYAESMFLLHSGIVCDISIINLLYFILAVFLSLFFEICRVALSHVMSV